MQKKKNTLTVIIILIVAISIASLLIMVPGTQLKALMYNKAEKLGLQNVKIRLRYDISIGWYDADVYCSNFEQFTPDQMIQIANALKVRNANNYASVDNVISNGSKYTIYPSTRSIYKNGEEFYDDYFNSPTHKSVTSGNSSSANDYQSVSSKDEKYWYAVTAAQNLVKDELKSPSTAKFSSSASDYTVKRKGNSYEVTGYVDAQNGFGATIRTKWKATFAMGDTSGKQYKITDYDVNIYE